MMRSLVVIIAAAGLVFTAAPVLAQESEEAPAAEVSGCDPDHVSQRGARWTVRPNGSDDTANMECALAEASEHPGTPTVRLTGGTFHLDFLFAEGFNGRIWGSGRLRTTIEPLEGGLDCKAVFDEFGFVFWMAFADSDLTMRDLAIDIPDVACTEPYIEDVGIDPETGQEVGFIAQDFNAMVIVATRSPEPTDTCEITADAGLFAKRIDIRAPQPDFSAPIFNPQGAFSTFFAVGTTPVNCDDPDTAEGGVVVKDVFAQGVGNLIQAQSINDSRIRVFRNHTVDVDTPVLLQDNEGTFARVDSNRLEGVTGAGIVSDNCRPPDFVACIGDASQVTIHHNDIDMSEIGGVGIVAWDRQGAPPQIDTRIWRNTITVNGNFAGVITNGLDGDRVARNTFHGASVFAVLVDGETTNTTIADNDMTDHTAFEAGILLGEDTSSNLLRRNTGATVIDLGTDNNHDFEPAPPLPAQRSSTKVTTDRLDPANRVMGYWSNR